MKIKKYFPYCNSYLKITQYSDTNSFCWGESNTSFVFSDICYCGHSKNEHANDKNQCNNKEYCQCEGFFP